MKKEYIIYKLSEEMKNATRIENELFKAAPLDASK